MREGLPSLTALAVAFARAAYAESPTLRDAAHDPIAARLLPFGLSHLARAMPAAWRFPHATEWALHTTSFGFLDHVALRTAAIDEALARAITAGTSQVVILGAGLDARAYRMEALRDAIVFEVDHPSTQQYVRSRIGSLVPTARDVRFVEVDFRRDSLRDRLAASGHLATARTFWIWEGVAPYLPHDAIRETLATVRACSAAESEIALTYITPAHLSFGAGSKLWARAAMGAIGEPLHGVIERARMHEFVEATGMRVESDTDTHDWALRYRPALSAARIVGRERLLVARVPSTYTATP